MYCAKCGYELRQGDNFCPLCGTKIEKNESAPETPAAPAQAYAADAHTPEAPVAVAAPPAEDFQDLPEDVHLPEGKDDPEISKAREDFIREFVATAPPRPAYSGKKPGRLLITLDLIFCSIAELAIIAYMVCGFLGVLAPLPAVYPISALICVVLIEVILLLAAAALRAKKKAAYPIYQTAAAPVSPAVPVSRPAAPETTAGAPAEAAPAEAADESKPVSAAEAPAVSVSVAAEGEAPGEECGPQSPDGFAPGQRCVMTFLVNGQRCEMVLDRFPATVGRAVINDDTVSENHFSVDLQEGEVVITDLESAFGVYVDGVKIRVPTTLKPEDTVLVGRASVVFDVI